MKEWCVSSAPADWLIAVCHPNLGDTLIYQTRGKPLTHCSRYSALSSKRERDRDRERQRQTETETERQTERERETETETETERDSSQNKWEDED